VVLPIQIMLTVQYCSCSANYFLVATIISAKTVSAWKVKSGLAT